MLKQSNNVELAFETSDFDGFLEKLNQYPQIERLNDVIEHDWGQRVIRFYDLDQHLIEVAPYPGGCLYAECVFDHPG